MCERKFTRIGAGSWRRRLELFIDDLIWAYTQSTVLMAIESSRTGAPPAGGKLRPQHFDCVPCTDAARNAFVRGDLKSIVREHIVPRAVMRRIVLQVVTRDDTRRVLDEYAKVALVDSHEATRLTKSTMPRGLAVDWSKLPSQLPDAWARYRNADHPRILPKWSDGSLAWDRPMASLLPRVPARARSG
jgi:hypothetical protein